MRKKEPLSKGDRLTLTKAQQRTAMALFVQRQYVMDEAQKDIDELNVAINDLADTYARLAGVGELGLWFFDQERPGAVMVLRREKEPPPQPSPVPTGEGEEAEDEEGRTD